MAIEDLKVGDIVLSRDEFDSNAAVAGRRVEAVFVRRAVVMSIGVGGRIIETTEEHPFWVVGKGWTAANAMRVGDRVLTATGEPLRIESVGEARREATVYNFRVEEWHTYFVGDPITWGFDVWVHNNHVAQAGQTNQALSPRAARRQAMREAGIPTSQQPVSQRSVRASDGTPAGRLYSYELPKPGGGKPQNVSVQHSLTDRGPNHGPHWEAGKIKIGGQTDSVGRPRLQNGKAKVNE